MSRFERFRERYEEGKAYLEEQREKGAAYLKEHKKEVAIAVGAVGLAVFITYLDRQIDIQEKALQAYQEAKYRYTEITAPVPEYTGVTLVPPPRPGEVTIFSAEQQDYYQASPEERLESLAAVPPAPFEGDVEVPVLCVEFRDQRHRLSDDHLQKTLQEVEKYFYRNSYGKLRLRHDVCVGGWVEAPRPVGEYYGRYPNNIQGLVEEAIRAVDPLVYFPPYANGDRFVDALGVVVAGENTPGGSHAWRLPGKPNPDDVRVTHYHTVAEIVGSQPFPFALKAHEECHGLYPSICTDRYSGDINFGQWSPMGLGLWNGKPPGTSPPDLDPDIKRQLGWANIQWVTEPGTVELLPYGLNPHILGLKLNPNEHYVFVNHTPGVDLPDDGLLVYHYSGKETSAGGLPNDFRQQKCKWPKPPKAMIEEADGRYDLLNGLSGQEAGDTFPGRTGTTILWPERNRPNLAAFDNCGSARLWVKDISPQPDQTIILTFTDEEVQETKIFLPLIFRGN